MHFAATAAVACGLFALIAMPACQSDPVAVFDDPASLSDSVLVLRNVTVLPMEPAEVWTARTVIIRSGRIETIGPATSTAIPAGAAVLEGQGRFLLPGLIDAHVHMRRADAPAYLRAGVLTVRNLWGHSGIRPLANEIEQGLTEGPEIVSASPGLDGSPPQWPETQLVDDALRADTVVAAQAAAGWRWIKVYQRLSRAAFDTIAASARRRGVQILGHVPTQVPILHALQSGMLSIEHLTGYDVAVSGGGSGTWGWRDADPSRFDALVPPTVSSGTWNVPTMAIYVLLARQHPAGERDRIIAMRREMVRRLHAAGAPIAAGTDAGIGQTAPGTSLLDELRELEASGFTRAEALGAATADAARLIGRNDLGRIAVGLPARLVLLNGNPLDDLSALARVAGIVRRGAWQATPTEENR